MARKLGRLRTEQWNDPPKQPTNYLANGNKEWMDWFLIPTSCQKYQQSIKSKWIGVQPSSLGKNLELKQGDEFE